MAPDANPPPRSASERATDEERLAQISADLGDAVEAAIPGWIERLVIDHVLSWSGHVDPDVAAAAVAAGKAAREEVMPRLRSLLAADIDDQRANPLALLRGATVHAHAVLAGTGAPPAPRDQFAQRSFPDDTYGLVPATWEDIDPSLHELGLTWGAAKAYVFKARRRDEGKR